mgnify:FL=1
MATKSSSLVAIRHKATECVGCCLCAETIPQYFQMNDEGMSVLVDANSEGVFDKKDALAMDSTDIEVAVEGCPVDIIRLDKT